MTTELGRKLTLTHVTSLVIGTVIGSGIFITLPLVARETGSPWLAGLSWLIGGLIWIPQILIVVEMGTAYPQQGFGYLYLEKAGSPLLGFLYVWTVFLTSDTPSISIICLTAISALATFSAVFADPWINRILAILLIVLLTLPHYRDVRGGGNFQIVLTVAKLLPLLLLVVLGFYYLKPQHFQVPVIGHVHNSLFHILGAGVAATVWSYAGFPNILYMAGEIKSPGRTLPWSLISSVVFVTVAYALISFAVSGIMPHGELAAVTGGFANPFAYLPIMAGIAAGFLAISAFISMLGAASACIMVQPRIEYALAKDGLFFKPFAHIHPRYHTPDYSLLIQSGLAALLVLVGGLESLLGYFTLSYVVQNGLVYGAIFRLRKRPDYQPTFKAPAWRLMAFLSLAAQLFLVYGTLLAYSSGGVLAAIFLIATGVPIYYRFKQSSGKG